MEKYSEILFLRGAIVALPDRQVLKDIHMNVGEGEFCYLRGRTGTGKSVFIESLYGLQNISGNVVNIVGQNIPYGNDYQLALFRRKIGFVSPKYPLLDDLTVFENLNQVLAGIEWHVASAREMRIHEVIHMAGLSELHNELVSRLSSGQIQKLKICRAVLNRPMLILADAPTVGLDNQSIEEVMDLLVNLASEQRSSILWATASDFIPQRYPARAHLCADGTISEMI